MRFVLALLVITSGLMAIRSELILGVVIPRLYRCSRSMWNVSSCVKRSIESMRPYLASGIKSLDIPSFKPYRTDQIEFILRNLLNGTATFYNVRIMGITNYTIRRSQITMDGHDIMFQARFPLVQLSSLYKINATERSSRLSILTRRKLNMYFQHLTTDVKISGEYFIGNNTEEYFRVTDTYTNLNVRDTVIKAVNNNNSEVHYGILQPFLIRHLQTLAKETKMLIEFIISNAIMKVANSIYMNFPTKMTFPH